MDIMKKSFDPAALGSDKPRSRKQLYARTAAQFIVKLLRLNRPTLMATEIVQAIEPVAEIECRDGKLLCRAGHGRLKWRADTFFEEEPETIKWLDKIKRTDVFWDIGSNVGLYAIYAAKFRHCRTFAFEPESQNYAVLLDNVFLNNVQSLLSPAAIPISSKLELGQLKVRYITKGGAFNTFYRNNTEASDAELPESFRAAQQYEPHEGLSQFTFGCSIDELVFDYGLPAPTFIKIDVDGIEPEIVRGAERTLAGGSVKSLLVELNMKSSADKEIPDFLSEFGFELAGTANNWDSRENATREQDLPALNMIFTRS